MQRGRDTKPTEVLKGHFGYLTFHFGSLNTILIILNSILKNLHGIFTILHSILTILREVFINSGTDFLKQKMLPSPIQILYASLIFDGLVVMPKMLKGPFFPIGRYALT